MQILEYERVMTFDPFMWMKLIIHALTFFSGFISEIEVTKHRTDHDKNYGESFNINRQ